MLIVYVIIIIMHMIILGLNNDWGRNNMNNFLGVLCMSFSFIWLDGSLSDYLEELDMQGGILIIFVWFWVGWLLIMSEITMSDYGITLSLGIGLWVVLSSDSWLGIYLGLELISLSMVILLGSDSGGLRNVEAMIKYFVVSSLGSGLFLLALLIIYWNTGSLSLSFTVFSYVDGIPIGGIGLDILRLSLLIKLGSWPVYKWNLDVLSGISNKQGLVLTTLGNLGGIYLLINLGWVWWLYVILLGGMLISLIGLITELKVGRFIGYSGLISDMILIYGLSLSINMVNIYIYLFIYFFNLWLVWNLVTDNDLLSNEVKGIYSALVLWSLGGLPPLLGFYTKWWLLSSVLFEGSYWLLFLVLFAGIWLLIIYGGWISFGNEQSLTNSNQLSSWSNISMTSWVWLGLLLGFILF